MTKVEDILIAVDSKALKAFLVAIGKSVGLLETNNETRRCCFPPSRSQSSVCFIHRADSAPSTVSLS